MRGRLPSGPEYVDGLDGSAEAKRRAKVILKTLLGRLRVREACQQLGVSEQRFQQLREEMLQAAVDRLETKPAGRPRATDAPADAEALKEKIAELEMELEAAGLREEIAVAFPHLVQNEEEQKKKRPSGRRGVPGRNGGKRSNAKAWSTEPRAGNQTFRTATRVYATSRNFQTWPARLAAATIGAAIGTRTAPGNRFLL
jgi:hypothetical protein